MAGHVSSEEVPLPDASPGRRQSPVGGLWGTPFRSGVHWLWEVPPVHELVHLGTYLLDGGLHLLAVDVDGYPAGAALCHKPVVCGKDGLNVRHGMGRQRKPQSC